jgi:hypothetical protein
MNIEPRGSSSIYRSKVITALDIEFLTPETTVEYPDLDTLFEFLLEENIPTKQLLIQEIKNPNGDHAARIQSRSARAGVSYEEGMDYLISKINSAELFKRTESKISEADPQEAIISGELQIFRDGKDVDSDNLRLRFFELTEEENGSIAKIVSSIGQVKRLREVRALASFIRGKGLAEVSVDQGASRTGWLPAIEAFGEGIYIELNKATLSEYFGIYGAAIDDCVHQQKAALKVMQDTYPLDYPDSPLFILTHTLSHLLIRQLTFNSGYSSSALRERLYIDSESQYAGILIYTTDTDSEGTLGGLVDQGRIEIITTVLRQIKESALWCSADPVCRETESQGFNNLNRSACHCCSLISETSCMYQNALLNRLTLGGMGSDREELLGFLEFAFGGST